MTERERVGMARIAMTVSCHQHSMIGDRHIAGPGPKDASALNECHMNTHGLGRTEDPGSILGERDGLHGMITEDVIPNRP